MYVFDLGQVVWTTADLGEVFWHRTKWPISTIHVFGPLHI